MLSNNQKQPKCLKCGRPMNESTCPNCGFNVMRESLLMVDKTGQLKDFYNSELAFFKEHNADQYFQTGLKYYNDGDYEEAFIWYQKAAELRHARAQNYLGYMYDCGQGVKQNYTEALKWYKLGADQGNAAAQNNLAVMYFNGKGVVQNDEIAFKWIKKSATQSDVYAQYLLGYTYEIGLGVKSDRNEAIKWYRKAAEQGHKEAREKLSNLSTNTNSKTENTGLKYSEDKIFFGSYYQNNQYKKEPIEWQILEKKGNKALLISKYALDCKDYNKSIIRTSWEKCTLRSWLNHEFINLAFTREECSKIVETTVKADANPKNNINPGKDTVDKAFLLSIPEVERYFNSDSERRCQGTNYCIEQGAYPNNGKVWWWLRSPGYDAGYAAGVHDDGSVHCPGYLVNLGINAVRPALWVNLES